MRAGLTRRAALFLAALASIPRTAAGQGEPLGPEFRVNTFTTLPQRGPRVAADASGNFVVVWISLNQDGQGNGVFAQRYAASGTPAGPEFRVNSHILASQGLPIAAYDSSGNFVVAWMSYLQDGSSWGTFGQRYAATGSPLGSEFRINTYTTGSQASAGLASDAAGNFVVVWQGDGQDGSGYGIFGQRYDGSGSPLGPEFRVNSYTTGRQADPSVACDSSGNFVVVWESANQDGSGEAVFGQRFATTGGPLGGEFRVNDFTTALQADAVVASSGSGDFVIVWQSAGQDGSGLGTFGRRFAASGAPLGPEFRVNTYTTGPQGVPRVAADPAGNFVVAWRSFDQDASGNSVFAQRFDASGSPVGPEFRVNTYTSGAQTFPSVAADANGRFVVAWEGDLQDGSDYGVFGQRFGAIVPVELRGVDVE